MNIFFAPVGIAVKQNPAYFFFTGIGKMFAFALCDRNEDSDQVIGRVPLIEQTV